MKYKLSIFGICIALIMELNTYAQTVNSATGGNASGSGGSVSYSIGQTVYQTYTEANGSVAEGVQQPYEISVVTAIKKAKGINLSISAYPNPATDYLTLEVKEFELSELSYHLHDVQGKLLQSGKIIGNQTNIAISDLVPSTYFVKVLQENKVIKTFKIFKN
ncbi:MAG: T9SS type A sorting domain-containing protein [Bacteroidales bacterium]|jgi:hypothetical protein